MSAILSIPLTPMVGAEQPRPVVPGYERFLTADARNDVAAGALLIGELGCSACHAAGPEASAHWLSKQAPILDQAGSRIRPEFIRSFLTDPQHAKPGTTMPDVFSGLSPEQKAEHVEALTHFLAATGELLEAAPSGPAIARGERHFHDLGCVACHNPQRSGAAPLATSAPLPVAIEAKYTLPSLTEFLREPLLVRPSGRMPHLNLTDQEAREAASYLLRNLEVDGVIEFAYYEGSWNDLPDFSRLEPVAQGKTASFDVNLGRSDQFGLVFRAPINVPADGNYTFFLGSDDGSRLLVDGHEVVANPGIHAMTWKESRVPLLAGRHDVQVEYFEQGGEQQLQIEIRGRGLRRQALEYLLVPQEPKKPGREAFQVDQGLAARGEQLFSSLGCAACHELRRGDQRLTSTMKGPAFAQLRPQAGCLAPSPRGVPDFQLDQRQRSAIAAALAELRDPQASPLPKAAISATLTALNCYACHARDGIGGVEPERNAFFRTDQPEMGDEGRIPPHLDGIGAKLQPAWLRRVLDRGAKDRPYMLTRMPRFGLAATEHLVELFSKTDPPVADHGVAANLDPRHLKIAGRRLVGAQGFSCIKCHTWGDVRATGIQAIDMLTMTRRLQENWFHEYLLNPQQYRPGTRMPAAWPNGQVLLPDVLDGQAMTQIYSIWEYLRDGQKAGMPVGLGANPIVLAADDEALIYRNFIEGAGARAIGVAYPEQVNLAFDANNLRLALLWHGAFIDASRHWIGRGAGFQPPLGDNVLALPPGVSFAVLEDRDTPWPNQSAKALGYQFRGYRLGEQQRPIFRYAVGSVTVEDDLRPLSKESFTPLRRALTLAAESPVAHLWYRAATGSQIEASGDTYLIDKSWRIRVAGPMLRESSGKMELLVPVAFEGGKATIVQDYLW